jgi:hypothetical protein
MASLLMNLRGALLLGMVALLVWAMLRSVRRCRAFESRRGHPFFLLPSSFFRARTRSCTGPPAQAPRASAEEGRRKKEEGVPPARFERATPALGEPCSIPRPRCAISPAIRRTERSMAHTSSATMPSSSAPRRFVLLQSRGAALFRWAGLGVVALFTIVYLLGSSVSPAIRRTERSMAHTSSATMPSSSAPRRFISSEAGRQDQQA